MGLVVKEDGAAASLTPFNPLFYLPCEYTPSEWGARKVLYQELTFVVDGRDPRAATVGHRQTVT